MNEQSDDAKRRKGQERGAKIIYINQLSSDSRRRVSPHEATRVRTQKAQEIADKYRKSHERSKEMDEAYSSVRQFLSDNAATIKELLLQIRGTHKRFWIYRQGPKHGHDVEYPELTKLLFFRDIPRIREAKVNALHDWIIDYSGLLRSDSTWPQLLGDLSTGKYISWPLDKK